GGSALDRVRRGGERAERERSERRRDLLVDVAKLDDGVAVGAELDGQLGSREEREDGRSVLLVAVPQAEYGKHRRADVGVVRPRVADAPAVLDPGPDHAQPGAADVFGRISVAPREVVVDAGRGSVGGVWAVEVERAEEV